MQGRTELRGRRKHQGESSRGNRNMSEAAEPASRSARATVFLIAFFTTAVGIEALWLAFLLWLVIRLF